MKLLLVMNSSIYLDYNATHPPIESILQKNLHNYIENFYNPSGPTRYSLDRQGLLEESRNYFANLAGKPKNSIVFCSTGTESNHYLVGLLKNTKQISKIYISPLEHSSMYGALEYFGIEPILLRTDFSGLVDLNDLEKKMKSEPLDVICIYAANETGVIQPISEISKITKKYDKHLYSDMMQAFAKIPVDFSCLDGFTCSGHKIGAGMGSSLVSFSGIEKKSEFKLFHGGNQENGNRAGTENTFAISCFAEATQYQIERMEEKEQRLLLFRERLENSFVEMGIQIISQDSPRLNSTSFVLLPMDDIDFFMMGMEERKIIISTGSSCKSRAREPAFSLLRMGYSKDEALRAIRISTGIFTQSEEIDRMISCTQELISLLKS
jgi:cysteine desulfurase